MIFFHYNETIPINQAHLQGHTHLRDTIIEILSPITANEY